MNSILLSGSFNAEIVIYCAVCKKKALSRHSLTTHRLLPDEIKKEVKRQMPNIPVGWTMNGRDDLRCSEKCQKARAIK